MASAFSIPDRLGFRLPDFTRRAWVSDAARAEWEPRIQRIGPMLADVEWRSAAIGERPAARIMVPEAELPPTRARLADLGLQLEPLTKSARSATYAGPCRAPANGEPFDYLCIAADESNLATFQDAYRRGDESVMGRLLGYPPCCVAFFEEHWVRRQLVDTCWPMAWRTRSVQMRSPQHLVIPPGAALNGVHLRWLGVRAVFHLPCSHDCEPTSEIAQRHLALAEKAGFGEEVSWLREMLAWPVEWSALHGIAEIKTPVVKIVTLTDATPSRYSITYEGLSPPKDAVVGLRFPYSARSLPLLSESHGYRRGLDNALPERRLVEPQLEAMPWYATDNGFPTRRSMDYAHRALVGRIRQLVRESPPPAESNAFVLDLGCGNGALLRKLSREHASIVPCGADLSEEKIQHARQMLPAFAEEFAVADMFDPGLALRHRGGHGLYLTLLMIGRLTEVPYPKARALLKRIMNCTQHLLVYVYDGYTRNGRPVEIVGLAREFGLDLTDTNRPSCSLVRLHKSRV